MHEESLLRTEIAGVDLREIARKFGTPCYLYDESMIERRIKDLSAFPVVRYAQKACSNLAILDLMHHRGVEVDAVSAGEIHRALLAGYLPSQIVYTADIFDHEALDLVVQHDIRVNCGSPDMISQFGARKPGGEVTLRLNPGFGHGHSQKTNTGGESSKHGIWHEQLLDCRRIAEEYEVKITGLHMHIGSGTDFEHLSHVCQAMEKAADVVANTIKIISAGGGLPVPYKAGEARIDLGAYAQLWLKTKESLERRLGRPVQLEVEPGRYLVAEAGHLLCEIRAIKRVGAHTFYLVNAGFNNLARPVMYGAYHPMTICPTHEESTEEQEVVVGGPLCESGDIFTQREGGFVDTRMLPKARVGDLLTIHCAGAYGFAMSSNYNSMPMAAEVLIRDGSPILVRKRQTFSDLVAGEVIPHRDEVSTHS
ncbi:Diaminopimelate decarboxylase [Planctomycetes bacterium Pan216]|uniref:Diaminopimelate decarboxylase n=1 Tax=Kolteria novifilia TaxID=2527975 RepID=A0A518AWV6_9BACT|nr:Diaminopimelate decarboxylase [Planctomycetes bacterium Pan216]